MTTARKKGKANTGSSSKVGLWLIVVSVAIVAIVVGIIVFNETRVRSAPVAQPDVPAEWISRNVVGSPDAKVVVQAWEDFLCPSCQDFFRTVKPRIIDEYVKTGQVRYEFHHFPLQQHAPGSFNSAFAAECAADQGMFWPYHDKLFQVATVDQQRGVQPERLIEYAAGMGMKTQEFTSCFTGPQHQDTVTSSLEQAQQLKLSFTPSILVNGQLLQQWDYNSVKAAVDAQLATAQ